VNVIKIYGLLLVTGSVAFAGVTNQSQSTPPPAAQNQQPPAQAAGQQNAPNRPRRTTAKLDGFDLAPDAASPNQIGGASRSAISSKKLVAYAPHKGRIFTLRPSFSWQGSPGTNYKLHIQSVNGQLSWDREVNGTSLDYPADAPPLEPGQTYIWRVSADSPMLGAPTAPAMIVVLSEAERSQLATAESSISGTGLDAETARARLYFDHRLWYDAVMAYSGLIAKHPEDAKLYLMRGSLYDQLPATQPLADQDFSRAN
jgi:Domain of Unknown Function (DUF928)